MPGCGPNCATSHPDLLQPRFLLRPWWDPGALRPAGAAMGAGLGPSPPGGLFPFQSPLPPSVTRDTDGPGKAPACSLPVYAPPGCVPNPNHCPRPSQLLQTQAAHCLALGAESRGSFCREETRSGPSPEALADPEAGEGLFCCWKPWYLKVCWTVNQ